MEFWESVMNCPAENNLKEHFMGAGLCRTAEGGISECKAPNAVTAEMNQRPIIAHTVRVLEIPQFQRLLNLIHMQLLAGCLSAVINII